jgi:hypothetical protein
MDVGVWAFCEFAGDEPFARGRSAAEGDISGRMR